MNPLRYHVAPRYTPGSPATVPFETAKEVANDETRAYLIALEGVYGERMKFVAEMEGLYGIVTQSHESRDTIYHADCLTGRTWETKPYAKNTAKRGPFNEGFNPNVIIPDSRPMGRQKAE